MRCRLSSSMWSGGDVAGVVGGARDGAAESLVAGPADDGAAAVARCEGDKTDADLRGELIVDGEALTELAEFGQELRRAQALGARETPNPAIGQAGSRMIDGGFGDLTSSFCLTGQSGRSCLQVPDQLGWRAAPAAGVLGEEGGQALFAQLAGPVVGGQATGEGGCDRVVVLGGGSERAEAKAVAAQDFRQQEGFARVALANDGALMRTAGLEHLGIDPDAVTGLDQGSTYQPGRPPDGDGQAGRHCHPPEPGQQIGQPAYIMPRYQAHDDLPGPIDDAGRVAPAAPISTAMEQHGLISWGRVVLARAARSPANRRPGPQAVARRTVIDLSLPTPTARRVACGSSTGERSRPSRHGFGPRDATPLRCLGSGSPEMHR
jgi:hypothetical protein